MKIMDEREKQTKKTKTEKNKGDKAIVKGWELNDSAARLS